MSTYVWNNITGKWDVAVNWTPDAVPGAGDSVTINAGGVLVEVPVTVDNVTLTSSDSELDIGGNFFTAPIVFTPPGTLTLTGTLTEAAGGIVIDGTLKGGTVVPGGKGVGFVNGTLDNTTWHGALAVSFDDNNVNIVDGLTLQGAGGTGPGTLSVTGTDDVVTMLGGGTLDNASIILDSAAADISGGTGTLTIGSNATVQASGAVALNGAAVVNDGNIADTGGTLTFGGALTNNGTISANSGSIDVTGAASGGSYRIGGAGTLDFVSGASGMVTFLDATGRLVVEDAGDFAATIGGFAAGNVIDLSHVSATGSIMQGGTLTLMAGGTPVADIAISGIADGTQFNLAPDGSGTDISLPCFAAGTRIATAKGNRAVEELQVGDLVMTASGGMGPAIWIGHRTVDCASHPKPESVWPVRVRAGAFGPGRPARDLMLSPDHSIHIDGALVPVYLLIDDNHIMQVPVDAVSYWHVELPRHEVILAEGLAVESFLDAGNRDSFANGGAVVRLHPSFAAASWEDACAPIVLHGERLMELRRRVQELRQRVAA